LQINDFLHQITLLTGTDIKDLSVVDEEHLRVVLNDDDAEIGCSQFNELLLLVNKDRVTPAFFDHLFGPSCTIGTIPSGVAKFQKIAMRCFGNFIFAYRTLSRIKDNEDFLIQLGEVGRQPEDVLDELHHRPNRLLNIDTISRDDTPLVGYLSAKLIATDEERYNALFATLNDHWQHWDEITALPTGIIAIVERYRSTNPDATLAQFRDFVRASGEKLQDLKDHVSAVRERATRNQDVYLTWDHMDIYFATSMRKPWEYEELYDFIASLTAHSAFSDLNLRYFDPTQCYTQNRVNKGLVEALMLKRAKCTVYSVQDTDTLGKDSELASTLAQGKTVIAYIPEIDVNSRAEQLAARSPEQILQRLMFVSYADESFADHLKSDPAAAIERLQNHVSQEIWPSLPDHEKAALLRNEITSNLLELCRAIAASEKVTYDQRAKTLINSHPLAIQVNLDTGVANGVLVVRSVESCAKLLRRVMLCDMEFDVENDNGMWQLRERISGCVYRVVTDDRKLNNCFWNFYLR
jgi:hypothetical protein